MNTEMFCFQCEQTLKSEGCITMGVCGKHADTANLQDKLTSSLIKLANTCDISEDNTKLLIDGLFTTVTNVNFDNISIQKLIDKTIEKSGNPDFDVQSIWNCNEDTRSLKSLILFGLRGMSAYAHHACVLGFKDNKVNDFFYEALKAISNENLTNEDLLKLVLKTGEINFRCMELLDKANTETYGNPEPTKVSMTIEKGPFIVISGHDLKDLSLLLEQTKDMGINIYTHGEMLPCHAYPELKNTHT